MDLNLLNVFAAVAESASFSKAGARLSVPKSTVSRAISQLEDIVGVRLVHRTTRSVSLSTAGRALYERTRPSLQALEAALVEIPERDEEPSGRLCVTAPVDFANSFLAPVVEKFLKQYPKVQLELRLTGAYLDISAEGIDVALRIASGPLKDSSLVARKLGRLRSGLFASAAYLKQHAAPKSIADLDAHAWVVFDKMPTFSLESTDAKTTVAPKGLLVCDELLFVRTAIARGVGVGCLPLFLASDTPLVRIMPKWSAHAGTLWAITASARLAPPKVVAFLETLQTALTAHV
jgi:DNA-binding transcriptional LysR family regulator